MDSTALDQLLKEHGVSGIVSADPRALMFDKQREADDSDSKAQALLCGRRAGKTYFFLLRAIRAMQKYPGCRVPYIALTRRSAEAIVWKVLEQLNQDLGLGLSPKVGNLKMVASNGAEIFLVGANKADEVEKLRGQKFPLVGIDEAASFRPSLLEYLIDDVLDAALMDYDGTIVLCSTPSAQPVGFFHDVTTGKVPGWDVYKWTALDNPHLPHARKWLETKRQQKGWEEDHPTYLREYMGQWIRDTDALVYRLNREKNVIQEMPKDYAPDSRAWAHVIGIDYGYVDSTSHVVWAFRAGKSADKTMYCVHASATKGSLPSEAAEATKTLAQCYHPQRIYGDAGGLGKPYVMEARRRFGIQVQNAEKTEKLAHVELFNDDLRRGRIKFVEPHCRNYIEELEILPWDMDRVIVSVGGGTKHEHRKREDPRFDNHMCDAGLYGNRGCTAFWNEATTSGRALQPGEDEVVTGELRREDESRYIQGNREVRERWWDPHSLNRWH